jgi:hypothetical protein
MSEQMLKSEKAKEDWMNTKWRPMMGWMYMLVCTMDFVGFPVLWSMMQAYDHGNVTTQWQPLTLQGAGLFHLAMGAVIGISSYGRTQEKLGGAAGSSAPNFGSFGPGAGTTYQEPTPTGTTPAPSIPTPAPAAFTPPAPVVAPPPVAFTPPPVAFTPPPVAAPVAPPPAPITINVVDIAPEDRVPPAHPVTGQVAPGYNGKLGPVPAPHPII